MIKAKDLESMSAVDKDLAAIHYIIASAPHKREWTVYISKDYPFDEIGPILEEAGYGAAIKTDYGAQVLVINVPKKVIDLDSQISFSGRLEVLGDDDEEKFWRGLEDVITKYVDEHGGVSDFEMVAL